jgi:hypothetical protein
MSREKAAWFSRWRGSGVVRRSGRIGRDVTLAVAIHDETEGRERQWARGKAGEMHEIERRVRRAWCSMGGAERAP